MLRHWKVVFLAFSILAGLVLSAGTSQAAAPQVSSPADVTGKFCVVWGPTGQIACVDRQADLYAAKAAILPNRTAAAQTNGDVSPQLGYQMGRFYDAANRSTASGYIDWYDSAGCTASTSDVNSTWSDTSQWRSRISSFEGASSCRIQVWENVNYGGATLGYASYRDNIGVLNDHVWSAKFT